MLELVKLSAVGVGTLNYRTVWISVLSYLSTAIITNAGIDQLVMAATPNAAIATRINRNLVESLNIFFVGGQAGTASSVRLVTSEASHASA